MADEVTDFTFLLLELILADEVADFTFLLLELILADEVTDFTFLLLELILADEVARSTPPTIDHRSLEQHYTESVSHIEECTYTHGRCTPQMTIDLWNTTILNQCHI